MGIVIIRAILNNKVNPSILKMFQVTGRAFKRGEYRIVTWKYGTTVQVRSGVEECWAYDRVFVDIPS